MKSKFSGFTLIELVIVIGILGVLVAVVISVLNPARFLGKGRDAKRQSDLKLVQTALEGYYSENNSYPADGAFSFGAEWSGYMKMVPQDTTAGQSYCYSLQDGGQGYLLCALSEVGISGGEAGNCGGVDYDYCLENPF